jgi:uncharacterized ferritin-like protein (DUF455 family)
MELADFARRVLSATSLDEKLRAADSGFTDTTPGPSIRIDRPGRPANLQFAPRRQAPAMPRGPALADSHRRGIAHHIMANHELQAVEVMAWTLLAFPEAPPAFRLGVAVILGDEQRHTRMHVERARTLGVEFGDYAVNSYIWQKSMEFRSPLDYVAGLPLLFEARNLDQTLEFAAEFEAAGDPRSAALMRTIHRDEIRHVAFGIDWLRKLKQPGTSDWDAFAAHLHWPLRPGKARGHTLDHPSREAAGLSPDFINHIAECGDEDESL